MAGSLKIVMSPAAGVARARDSVAFVGNGLRVGVAFALLVCSMLAWGRQPVAPGNAEAGARTAAWITRLQQASESSNYSGIHVVSSGAGFLSSAHIWHLWEGEQEHERVDTLSGPERRAYRRGNDVMLVLPGTHMVVTEPRGARRGILGGIGTGEEHAAARHYQAEILQQDRVAGLVADVVRLRPVDAHRFGYRIWSEQTRGLPLKIQILDDDDKVLEQAFFSEIRLDLPAAQITPQLQLPSTEGYRIRHVARDRFTASERVWSLTGDAAGFELHDCWHRHGDDIDVTTVDQCVMSDGLASVSFFFEPYEAKRHSEAKSMHAGAVHAISRKWSDASGQWWITLIGEVPAATLDLLAQSLRRGS